MEPFATVIVDHPKRGIQGGADDDLKRWNEVLRNVYAVIRAPA